LLNSGQAGLPRRMSGHIRRAKVRENPEIRGRRNARPPYEMIPIHIHGVANYHHDSFEYHTILEIFELAISGVKFP
jgi:hypothetical protein